MIQREEPSLQSAPEQTAMSASQIADQVARLWLDRAGHVRFGVARTPEEHQQIFRLRYDTCIARGWIEPGAHSDGIERDQYDERALHLAGWVEGSLICTARLVLPQQGYPLPIQEIYGPDLDLRDPGGLVEANRLIVVTQHPARTPALFPAILGHIWLEITARGYTALCGTLSELLVQRYQQLGIAVTVLGPPQPYFGEQRYPVRLEVLASATRLAELHLGTRPTPAESTHGSGGTTP